MKKFIAILALAAFSLTTPASLLADCGACPGKDKSCEAKQCPAAEGKCPEKAGKCPAKDGKCPAGGDQKKDQKQS